MKSPKYESSDSPIGRSSEIGCLADLHHPLRLVDRDPRRLGGDFLDRGLAALGLHELLRDVAQLAHRLDHVDRDADGARLVGDRAGDRLADPPRRVGRELVAAAVLVLLHRLHQARVAFLDQIEEGQAAVAVLLGDRDDETQVAARELALGLFVLGEVQAHLLQTALEARSDGSSDSSLELAASARLELTWPPTGALLRALEGSASLRSVERISRQVLVHHFDVGAHLLDLQVALLDQDHELAADVLYARCSCLRTLLALLSRFSKMRRLVLLAHAA